MGSPEVVRTRPRVALVGGGFIGPVHAEALRRIGAEVVGLLGSSPDRARPLAERLGIPRVYDDLDALLADPDVQAVHVASPNAAHFEQARRVLESGRHVVCEKPLATTPEQTRQLRDLARARPWQAAAVNYNVRYYPLCHEMRQRVARGDVGDVLSVTGSYTQDWLLYPDDYNWRVEPDGGTNLRAVADIGTHWMDLAQYVVGRPIRAVLADLATFHRRRNKPVGPSETFSGPGGRGATRPVDVSTEDFGAVLFRMGDGARGAFHVSQTFAGRKNRLLLEVAGTLGALAWDSEQPERLWVGRRSEPNQMLSRDPALLSPEAAAISAYPGGHAEGFPDTFAQLARDVYRWAGDGGAGAPGFPTFDDGHREVLLCEAVARSAREAAWAEVADV
jgi:predicted dehydrogenase